MGQLCEMRGGGRGVPGLLVCLLGLLLGAVGGAQPGLDEGAVVVRLLTRQGTPLPMTQGVSVQLLSEAKVAVPGVQVVWNGENQSCSLFGMRAGRYLLKAVHGTLGLMVEQPLDFTGGIIGVEVRFPTCTLAVQWTKDGVPVSPRGIRAWLRPVKAYGHEVAIPLSIRTEGLTLMDAVPTGDSEVTILTDVGYASCRLTLPPGTERHLLTVALQPGGVADIMLTDGAGTPLTHVPVLVTLAGGLRFLLETDEAGRIQELHLPVGLAQCASHLNWLMTTEQKYRHTSVPLTISAGQPATATLRLPGRQTLTGRCLLAGVPVTPAQGMLVYAQIPTRAVLHLLPITWTEGRFQAQGFFPDTNRMHLFTDLGYGQVEFPWPADQTALEQPFALQADGGVISVTGKEPLTVTQCVIGGRVPGPTGAWMTVNLMLPQSAPGCWRSPQLPPGAWQVTVGGTKPFAKSVTLEARGVVEITLP
jgi:hypothetical protein